VRDTYISSKYWRDPTPASTMFHPALVVSEVTMVLIQPADRATSARLPLYATRFNMEKRKAVAEERVDL
jgi:hypothetical protein